ncbi:MAG TPA: proton-conducting transporter membrane subunit [Dongiaceae bacterium]|nr:proton-conducting transporter membrane subunit [Dongiaceae bacterium]
MAVLATLPALTSVLALLPSVKSGQAFDTHSLLWDGPLALVLHVDGLSVLFAFMGTLIGAVVLLYSIGYMAEDKAATRFYAIMLTFIGGLVGLVYSANLFLMYFCWEVVGLCSFGLVGFWYTNQEAVAGARKVLLMTHLAGYGLLIGILTLYARTGSALWTDPAVGSAFSTGVFVLMLVALVAKSVQFPLHTWIPEAMAAPTPVSALLHAACYVKAGVYLAARMHSFGAWPATWGTIMISIGSVTMIVGVMYAMVQSDLKRMLAFHTVSQIGYMITGIGIGTPLAITAGLLHCLNHGFFKGGLFLSAGAVQHAAGTRDMNKLGGLAPRMSRTTAAWLVNAASIMGFPLTSGFVSKWMLYTAALQAGLPIPALAAWVASLGTVFSFAKATSNVFLGAPTVDTEHAHEAPASMQWGLGLMALGSVVLGIAPQLAVAYLLNPVLGAFGLTSGVRVTWLGISSAAGSWWTTGGLILALVSLGVGALIYMMARPSRVVILRGAALAGGGVFTGGEPLSGEGRLPASDFSTIFKEQWAKFFEWINPDRYYLDVWEVLHATATGLASTIAWAERYAVVWTLGLALLLFACLGGLATPVNGGLVGTALRLPLLFPLACGLAWGGLCLSAVVQPVCRRFVPLMAIAGALALLGLLASQPRLQLVILEASAFCALLLVWQSAAAKTAKWIYLAVVVYSAITMAGGDLLLERGSANGARALIISGFFVKLAIFPLFLWLLRLADELPSVVLGLIISVIDIAGFGELWRIVQNAPFIATPTALWLGLAVFSALAGSLLMLAQRDLKRLLVLSTIEDLGFLLLGTASLSEIGISGAMTGAAVHALAKALLFVSLSTPEAAGKLKPDSVGLTRQYPFSGGGFLFGLLAMLGVPPTLGFIARWRIYEMAIQAGPWVLVLFVISSGLSLIAYTLALTRCWWGPGAADSEPCSEPVLLRTTVIVLTAVLLAGGFWPHALQALTRGVR